MNILTGAAMDPYTPAASGAHDGIAAQLIESLPSPVFYKDMSGRYLGCNKAFEDFCGIGRDALIGRTVNDIWPGELADVYHAADTELLERGGTQVYEAGLQYADGSRHDVLFHRATFRNADGSQGGIAGVVWDISDRKRAEQSLVESGRRHRALIESISELILIISLDGIIQFASGVSESLTGYAESDLVGQSVEKFVDPLDRIAVARILKDITDHPSTLMRGECRLCAKDGERREWDVTCRNLALEPAIGGLVVTLTDITARKQTERLLSEGRTILQTQQDLTPDGILVVDSNHRVLSANRQFAQIWRLQPEMLDAGSDEEAILLRAKAQTLDPERFASRISGLYDKSSRNVMDEVRLCDGRFIEIHSSAIPGTGHDEFGRVWFCRDITLRRQTEQLENDRLQRMLAHAAGIADARGSEQLAAGNVQAYARELTEIASRTTGVARASVWLFDHDETELRCIDLYEAAQARHSDGDVLRQEQFESEFRALKCAQFVAADQALTDPRTSGYAEGYLKPLNIKSLLDAVVAVSDKRLGLLCLEHVDQAHHWLDDETVFACQMATQIGLALLNRARLDAEGAERESGQHLRLFRALVDQSGDAIEVVDPVTLRLLDVNARACADLGYGREELLTLSIPDIDPEHVSSRSKDISDRLSREGAATFETNHRRKNGSTFPVEVSAQVVSLDRPYILTVARDISERKRTERALIESEIRFRTLIEGASDVVAVVSAEGIITYVSPAIKILSGYEPAAIIGQSLVEFIHPMDLAAANADLSAIREVSGMTRRSTRRFRHSNGSWRIFESIARSLLDTPPVNGIVINLRDVTERERYTRALSAMSAANSALIHAEDESSLLKETCNILVGIGSYRMAWTGMARPNEGQMIVPVAWAGTEGGILTDPGFSWEDNDLGRGPTGAAIRTGTTQICRDFVSNIDTGPWHAKARDLGYASSIAVPLMTSDSAFGALSLYSSEVDAFDAQEVTLLQQLAGDVAFGIRVLRDRTRHATDLQRLERSMEETVHVLAGTVERRDPYTAGHQRRVAQLSVALAHELRLEDDRVHGLELAAMIHDIGKIDIPSEILAKPGKLSDIEYAFVKTHAQAGHEILKDVKFPWPIAEIVWQHHEALDGSGYPRGLKGEQIMLEARILTVADVVEAMSSHRPYRPGLGIAAAMTEIKKGRGSRFDAAVVDACVTLIEQKRFAFS